MTSPSTLLGDVKPMRVITDRGEGNMHAKPPTVATPERPPETAAEKPEANAFGTDDKEPTETTDKTEPDTSATPIPEAAPGEYDPEVYLNFELRDESAIILEHVSGAAPGQFVYTFTINTADGPRNIYGTSWEGTKELKRWYRYIDANVVTEETERRGEPGILATATAIDRYTGNRTQSIKFVPYMGTRANGSRFENLFAEEVAQSKAKRNAINELLPQWLLRALIVAHKKGIEVLDAKVLGLEGDRYRSHAKPQAHRANLPPGPQNAEPPAKLSDEQLGRLWQQIREQANEQGKKADLLRRLAKNRIFIMAAGDMQEAIGYLRRITTFDDFDGYESIDRIPARGHHPTALQVAYGKIKTAFIQWCKEHELDPITGDSTPDAGEIETAKHQVLELGEKHNIPPAAYKAAAAIIAQRKEFGEDLWPRIVLRHDTHQAMAINHFPSAQEQHEAEHFGERAAKQYFLDIDQANLTRKKKIRYDEDDALTWLERWTGVQRDDLTAAHFIHGRNRAESILVAAVRIWGAKEVKS